MAKKKTGLKTLMPRSFYQEIGRKGGRAGKGNPNRGFGCSKVGADGLTGPERARIAGRKGGFKSRRGAAKKK